MPLNTGLLLFLLLVLHPPCVYFTAVFQGRRGLVLFLEATTGLLRLRWFAVCDLVARGTGAAFTTSSDSGLPFSDYFTILIR